MRASLPTVSCFIPSILPGSPFRVSLHSWSTPTVSRETAAGSSQDGVAGFEAKVLLDGVCIACVTVLLVSLTGRSWLTNDGRGTLLGQDPPWPQMIGERSRSIPSVHDTNPGHSRYVFSYGCLQVIEEAFTDTEPDTDKDGNRDQLRFPPFHTEVLTQTWANPAQNVGRIKVVIAEGINHGLGVSTFERTKNLVSFSFQHAPLREAELEHQNPLVLMSRRYTGELRHSLAKPGTVLPGCSAISERRFTSHASRRSCYACPFSPPPERIIVGGSCKARSDNRTLTYSAIRILCFWAPE